MEEMTRRFYNAFGTQEHRAAIRAYDNVIEHEPDNFAAWNNRGSHKITLAHETSDGNLLLSGIDDIQRAISLAALEGIDDYPIARGNLQYAKAVQGLISKSK
jgi:hypothetical protein